jgi:hypothetical protein
MAIVRTLDEIGITAAFAIASGIHVGIAVCMLMLNRLRSCRKHEEAPEEDALDHELARADPELWDARQ